VDELRRTWKPFESRVTIEWLDRLPFADVLERMAILPPRTVVVLGTMIVDAGGVPHELNVALESLRGAANAPVFGFFDVQLGHGIVGGHLIQTRRLGAESARAAVRILAGESAASIAPAVVASEPAQFDARELERWRIRASLLPPGSDVHHRDPSAWNRYRGRIIAIAALCIVQTVLIVVILAERRRARAAQRGWTDSENRAGELRQELHHFDRVALAGQFTTSLAHELGQPLGAILRNADAAELFMRGPTPDIDEIRAIVTDIRRDGERAAGIIDRLRALLRRQDVDMQALDCRSVVDDVFAIVRARADAMGIQLAVDIPPGTPPVRGDRVHVQQVLLNLVANAVESIEASATGERRIVVATHRREGHVEFGVRDTGAGIAQQQPDSVFTPFVTTKSHGMGMGLTISRTIVEVHGGRIGAENSPGGGARFWFTIPVDGTREEF
jgi:signal transduction histidine kinase